MKTIIIGTTLAILLTGCRTVYESEVPVGRFPFPPTSLVEFVNSPKDGVYALPDVVPMPADYFRSNILVVHGGRIWLSKFQDNCVSTSEWDIIEYKVAFPVDADLVSLSGKKTEMEILSLFGTPTREDRAFIPFLGIESSNTKHATYDWFTLLQTSEIMFMSITVNYVMGDDHQWTATSLQWWKSGGRRLLSNNPAHPSSQGSQGGR